MPSGVCIYVPNKMWQLLMLRLLDLLREFGFLIQVPFQNFNVQCHYSFSI